MSRPLFWFAVIVVVTVLGSACSSSDDQTGEAPTDRAVEVDTSGAEDVGSPPPFFWEPGGDPGAPALVDTDEIIAGGPPPDGIPPIDDPQYVTVAAADEWLSEEEPVMVVELDGQSRAYPVQILTFHEIVNDTLAGRPVLVTYCPLCNSGLAFDPRVDGDTLDFGTSGRLYRSNLVMYDRQTQSLWSQFTGQAVVGPQLGTTLERLPLGLVAWADFRAAHPEGDVLSRDTGHDRDYGANPYVGYDSGDTPFLYDGPTDGTLPQMARIVATGGADDPIAVPLTVLQSRRVVGLTVGNVAAVAWWTPGVASALDTAQIADGADVGASGVFATEVDGRILSYSAADDDTHFVDDQTGSRWNVLGEAVSGTLAGTQLDRLESDDTFWFVQYAFRPATEVLEG